ncbi:MAG: hypothetical protein HY999_00255, partial [Nitrospinae bacterium]|nr:hypothetical protein [Nitrospinota bacterium]
AEFDKEGIEEEELASEEKEALLAEMESEEDVDEDVDEDEEIRKEGDIEIKEGRSMGFEDSQRKDRMKEMSIGEGGLKGTIELYVKTVAERVLKETIKTTVSDLSKEISNTVKEVVGEVIPGLARRLIKEEIEKIKQSITLS